MIRKFNEYINESLWKSGIERSRKNETRKEEKSVLDVLLSMSMEEKYEAARWILDEIENMWNGQIFEVDLKNFLKLKLDDDWYDLGDILDKYFHIDKVIIKLFEFLDRCKEDNIPELEVIQKIYDDVLNHI